MEKRPKLFFTVLPSKATGSPGLMMINLNFQMKIVKSYVQLENLVRAFYRSLEFEFRRLKHLKWAKESFGATS
jgi:hypothetical protein